MTLFDECGIPWVRNVSEYFLYNTTKKYYPDFYLPAHDVWVEVKGKYYFRANDMLKWSTVKNLHVVWHDSISLEFLEGIG